MSLLSIKKKINVKWKVKVKEMMQEGLIHNFWVSNGSIIKNRVSAGLAPFSVTHKNDLILEYCFWTLEYS